MLAPPQDDRTKFALRPAMCVHLKVCDVNMLHGTIQAQFTFLIPPIVRVLSIRDLWRGFR